MPLQATSGAASYDGFGGGPAAVPNYIEEVFQTWLYTGNGSTQTITNGIDLSTKGGLVWTKSRSAAYSNALQDTVRGRNNILFSNSDVGNQAYSTSINSFNTTGYTLGSETLTNQNGTTYVGWTFREQAKFFDVVTYTGNGGGSPLNVSHNLGSVPGCILIKPTTTTGDWIVYHRGIGNTAAAYLNLTNTPFTSSAWFNNTSPTSTQFTVGSSTSVNANGTTYVAYLFAHNAGGFGLTGTDNVITCGSFTTDGSGFVPDVNLGYEPQWLLLKQTNSANAWFMFDNMRGWSQTNSQYLYANSSGAEASWNGAAAQYYGVITPTGFKGLVSSGINNGTFIYIAIRRGPMKTPTTGTSVFAPFSTAAASGTTLTTNFPVDSAWFDYRGGDSNNATILDRLRGTPQTSTDTASNAFLITSSTAAETTTTVAGYQWWNTGITIGPYYGGAAPGTAYWNFRRAPGFFDVVCYTGTGAAALRNHNLGVAPELMIIKSRNFGGQAWAVYSGDPNQLLRLNTTAQIASAADTWNYTTPTSTQFGTGTSTLVGASGWTYVAYLFASCPGVSKVGSYTGTGALQTINCGFTGGARFVLIKRTDDVGDWWVYDSARGITSGNDPYLFINSTAAEVTGTNYVDTTSVGFQVTAAAPAGLNANGGTYIFLAIA